MTDVLVVRMVEVGVPLAGPMKGVAMPARIDLRLQGEQVVAMRKIFDGFRESGAQLSNGKYINTTNDAVKKLIELVGAAGDR